MAVLVKINNSHRVGNQLLFALAQIRDGLAVFKKYDGMRAQAIGADLATFNATFGVTATDLLDTAGAVAYTAAQLRSGYIRRDPNGAARTDTTATGAQIDTAFPDLPVGGYWDFGVINEGAATEDITFNGATGVTGAFGAVGIGTVEDGELAWFRLIKLGTATYRIAQLSL